MNRTKSRSSQQGVSYQVRTLTDRWAQPMGNEVLSTHSSAQAALDAFAREPQTADDGTGRSTYGSFVPKVVIRVNGDGTESITVPRPLDAPGNDRSGGGRW